MLTAALLRAQAPEVLRAIEREIVDAMERFAKDGRYSIPYSADESQAPTSELNHQMPGLASTR